VVLTAIGLEIAKQETGKISATAVEKEAILKETARTVLKVLDLGAVIHGRLLLVVVRGAIVTAEALPIVDQDLLLLGGMGTVEKDAKGQGARLH